MMIKMPIFIDNKESLLLYKKSLQSFVTKTMTWDEENLDIDVDK